MRKITNLLAVALLVLLSLPAFAKPTVKQIIVASGGKYGGKGNLVRFFAYEPSTQKLTQFDSVPGNFTRAAIVHNGIAYLTADDKMFRYDLDTWKKLDSLSLPGINKLVVHGNYLIVTLWYPATSKYIQIYDITTMKQVYADAKIKSSAKGIVVLRDTAYIAEESSDSGRVAVIALGSTPSFVKEYNLGDSIKNPQDIFSDGKYLYLLSYPYTGTQYVSAINPTNGMLKNWKMTASTGIGYTTNSAFGPGLIGNFAFDGYGILPVNGLTKPAKASFWTNFNKYVYTGTLDSINNKVYFSNGGFTSKAWIFAADLMTKSTNPIIDSFKTDLAVEAIAVDYRGLTNVDEATQNHTVSANISPNPATDFINITLEKTGASDISIRDITGRIVLAQNNMQSSSKIDISKFPAGIYMLTIKQNGAEQTYKVLKTL